MNPVGVEQRLPCRAQVLMAMAAMKELVPGENWVRSPRVCEREGARTCELLFQDACVLRRHYEDVIPSSRCQYCLEQVMGEMWVETAERLERLRLP